MQNTISFLKEDDTNDWLRICYTLTHYFSVIFDHLSVSGRIGTRRGKTSAVCGPHLQSSAEEEVVQTSAVCTKKTTSAENVFPPADLEPCLPARRRFYLCKPLLYSKKQTLFSTLQTKTSSRPQT
ncbi:hypothetical protein LXL04_012992 [Taraxacum kok-saghyz]